MIELNLDDNGNPYPTYDHGAVCNLASLAFRIDAAIDRVVKNAEAESWGQYDPRTAAEMRNDADYAMRMTQVLLRKLEAMVPGQDGCLNHRWWLPKHNDEYLRCRRCERRIAISTIDDDEAARMIESLLPRGNEHEFARRLNEARQYAAWARDRGFANLEKAK